jgi:hypothetical protein
MSPRYSLDRRLGGPQSHSRCSDEEENSQPLPGIESYNANHPPCSLVAHTTNFTVAMKEEFFGDHIISNRS